MRSTRSDPARPRERNFYCESAVHMRFASSVRPGAACPTHIVVTKVTLSRLSFGIRNAFARLLWRSDDALNMAGRATATRFSPTIARENAAA